MKFNSLIATLTLVATLTLPGWVSAASFRTGDTTTIAAGETISDDLYVAAGTITVDGTIDGDLVMTGGMVRLNGTVTGDVIAAGGQIQIEGSVGDDIRAAGGQVTIGGQVADDILAAGGDVQLTEGSTAGGAVVAAGGQVTLAGTAQSAQISAGQVTIASSAVINGDLTYSSQERANIAEGARITGRVEQQPMRQPRANPASAIALPLLSLLASAIITYLFLLLIPNKARSLVADSRRQPGTNLLWGFLFLIVTPIIIALLAITVIGIPLALITLVLYLILLYLGNLTATIIAGTWLIRWVTRNQNYQPNGLAVLTGVIALALIGLIPIIGWLIVFIVFLLSLGALIRYDWQLLGQLRTQKQL